MTNLPGAMLGVLFTLVAVAVPATAVETRVWDQSDFSDFSRGVLKNLSIRSDGHLTLATSTHELDSTSVPYLWAMAKGSAGIIYYAGGAPTGATAKVFAMAPGGKSRVLADIPGLEIHALAVDKEDRVYAAVLPDAKVYRIGKDGKPELFFDPKCKYIWAMAFDRSGNLYLATGDSGIIYRVSPDGKGSKFFDSEETHVRSMIMDSDGDLIAGTEPSGLVMRITTAGKSFVLYETGKREVTALAEQKGLIYAASVGSKSAAPIVTGPSPVLPSSPSPVTPAGTPRAGTAPPPAAAPIGSISAQILGGSEVYRITKEGFAERIWQSPSELAYALAFDGSGKPLVGTGNKGGVYRIDNEVLWTRLLTTPPTQVTAFLQQEQGSGYMATGNVGNLYSFGPGMETSGTLTSEVLDAHDFTYWGKAHVTSELHGGSVSVETRSGNLNNPENGWSSWAPIELTPQGGQVQSPAARFLQYRLTLKAASPGGQAVAASPEVSLLDIAYLPKNIAPRVRAVEAAPLNYREAPGNNLLERNINAAGSPTTLTLPAVGRRTTIPSAASLDGSAAATLQYSKGFVTIRWSAADANDDSMLYKLELRRKGTTTWQMLRDKLTDRYYAFDTTAFPDGEYTARVTASDAPSNIPPDVLTGSLESDVFRIDNAPPEIVDIKAEANGNQREITFTAKDAASWINKAEYSKDGSDWTLLDPLNRVTDSQTLSYKFSAPQGPMISVRVFDENDNVTVRQVASQ